MSRPIRLGWPNRISLARILCVAPFVVILLNLDEPGRSWLRWAAVGLFGMMAASDALDGYLARRMKDESPLGAFLDPLGDKLLVTAAVIILAVQGILDDTDADNPRRLYLPDWAAVAAIGKDLVVCIGFGLLRLTTGRIHIRPSRLGKWCTTVQLAMVLSILVWPNLPPMTARLPEALWTAATILAVLAALAYIRTGIRIQSADAGRPPGDGASSHA